MWKNGKNGYEEMLSRFNFVFRSKMINYDTLENGFLHMLNVVTTNIDIVTDSWILTYQISEWFGDIYRYFTENNVFTATTLRKTLTYRLINNILWKHHMETYFPYVPKNKLLDTFIVTYNGNSHWVKINIFVRLKNLCYWPGQF